MNNRPYLYQKLYAEKSPCEHNCPRQGDCRESVMSCQSFNVWVQTGVVDDGLAQDPTPALYKNIFGGKDESTD